MSSSVGGSSSGPVDPGFTHLPPKKEEENQPHEESAEPKANPKFTQKTGTEPLEETTSLKGIVKKGETAKKSGPTPRVRFDVHDHILVDRDSRNVEKTVPRPRGPEEKHPIHGESKEKIHSIEDFEPLAFALHVIQRDQNQEAMKDIQHIRKMYTELGHLIDKFEADLDSKGPPAFFTPKSLFYMEGEEFRAAVETAFEIYTNLLRDDVGEPPKLTKDEQVEIRDHETRIEKLKGEIAYIDDIGDLSVFQMAKDYEYRLENLILSKGDFATPQEYAEELAELEDLAAQLNILKEALRTEERSFIDELTETDRGKIYTPQMADALDRVTPFYEAYQQLQTEMSGMLLNTPKSRYLGSSPVRESTYTNFQLIQKRQFLPVVVQVIHDAKNTMLLDRLTVDEIKNRIAQIDYLESKFLKEGATHFEFVDPKKQDYLKTTQFKNSLSFAKQTYKSLLKSREGA